MRIRLAVLVLAGFLLFPSFSIASPPSANLPLDSWVYPALDKLAGLSLVDSSLQASRPYTRAEAARQVLEARDKAVGGDLPPVVYQLLHRLEDELRDQLPELEGDAGSVSGSYFKPIRSLELKYIYHDATTSHVSGTNASQAALNYNNFGIDYSNHQNAQMTFESEARLTRFFLLNIRPILELQDNDHDEGGSDLRLLEGKAALGLGPFEFSAGRQSLWWGQGRHGSLILTNNAKPLDMVRVNNPHPLLLPWVFRFLGPFGIDLFVSQLEEGRVVPEPYFGGIRIAIKPRPWFELGACRTVMFGGRGRPDVDLSDFLTIIAGENLMGNEDTSNSIAAIDARLRFPGLWGVELYGEMGGEDEADLLGIIPFISNKSYLGGIFFPQLEPTGRVSLRVEYADLSHIDENSPAWYRHETYLSGYTYKKKILGHHVGGAASDFFSELKILLSGDLTLSLSYDYEERGVDNAVEEKHHQPGVELEWWPSANIAFNASYFFDKVENVDFVHGHDKNNHLAELKLTSHW